MGSGSWSRDVPTATRQDSRGYRYSDEADKALERERAETSLLMTGGREISCDAANIVSFILDGTGSMGGQSRMMRDKSMMMVGQVNCQQYLQNAAFNISVIGDAHGDRVPLQMTEFVETPEDFKALIGQLYLEGGGGGQGMESYDLALYAYARRVKLSTPNRKFLFILGDEGFYPIIEADFLKRYLGLGEAPRIETLDLIRELQEFWQVYSLHISTARNYGAERDKKIQAQWKEALGENAIYLKDPNAAVDVMLGCIALVTGVRTLDDYIDKDLVEREQTVARRALVRDTLDDITWVKPG